MKMASASDDAIDALQASNVAGSDACRCRSEMQSTARQPGLATSSAMGGSDTGEALEGDCLLDHDVLRGHVVVHAFAAGLHARDAVDDVGAPDHLAEHGIAPALAAGSGVVQETVVGDVDEE